MNIEDLRKKCLSFPNVTEDIKWEKDLCFCIGDKMFCVTGLEVGHSTASLKVSAEDFTAMIEKEGIVPAPYLARYNWVLVKFGALSENEWSNYLLGSYQMVKSKLPARIQKALD